MSRSILGKKGLTELKRELIWLGKARNQADYEKIASIDIDEGTTKYYIYLAKRIIKGLRK